MKKPVAKSVDLEVSSSSPAVPAGVASLLNAPLVVVNIGLSGFADELQSQGVTVTQVDWQPPAGGDARMAALLAKLGT